MVTYLPGSTTVLGLFSETEIRTSRIEPPQDRSFKLKHVMHLEILNVLHVLIYLTIINRTGFYGNISLALTSWSNPMLIITSHLFQVKTESFEICQSLKIINFSHILT